MPPASPKEDITEIRKRLQQLELREALTEQEMKSLRKTIDGYGSSISRGLWIVGGGFIMAIVSWISQGGLNGK
jgi:hypothetical protein|tara:strand:- start:3468 stop:3686 length:219 start_codon:yes stop_codon:yes gene_type:complete